MTASPCATREYEVFSEVVPLGSLCASAKWIEDKKLRKAAFPFDWSHSSVRMVRHCLSDDFRTLLDRSQYFRLSEHKRLPVGHCLYGHMLAAPRRGNPDGRVIWPHTNPLEAMWHDKLHRAVCRLRSALRTRNRKRLFIIFQRIDSAKALNDVGEKGEPAPLADPQALSVDPGCEGEVRCLYQDLLAHDVANFHLAVVRLCAASSSRTERREEPRLETVVEERTDGGTLSGTGYSIHNLHMIDHHTGLKFKDSRDEQALVRLLFGSKEGLEQRINLSEGSSAPLRPRRRTSRSGNYWGGYQWSQEWSSETLQSTLSTSMAVGHARAKELSPGVICIDDSIEPTPPAAAAAAVAVESSPIKICIDEQTPAKEVEGEREEEDVWPVAAADTREAAGLSIQATSKEVLLQSGSRSSLDRTPIKQVVKKRKRAWNCLSPGAHVVVVDQSCPNQGGFVAIVSAVDTERETYSVVIVGACDERSMFEERIVEWSSCIQVGHPLRVGAPH